jgi:acetyltransferase-like isoleucine patch superfamily enzyme
MVLSGISSWISKIFQRICMSDSRLYVSFLRKKGAVVGNGTVFFGHVTIDFSRPCLVEIGRNCIFTDGVTLLTHGFDWAVLREKYGEMVSSSGKVVVEDNVFVGVNAIILKGTRIGKNTIIGAGSVVTHDIPSDCVAAGNPCKVIMSLGEYYKKRKKDSIEEAKAYALELYKKTGKIPKIEDFWEEFPIFLKRDPRWGTLPVKDQLGSAFENFVKSQPTYGSFRDFLLAAGIPKEKLKSVN